MKVILTYNFYGTICLAIRRFGGCWCSHNQSGTGMGGWVKDQQAPIQFAFNDTSSCRSICDHFKMEK